MESVGSNNVLRLKHQFFRRDLSARSSLCDLLVLIDLGYAFLLPAACKESPSQLLSNAYDARPVILLNWLGQIRRVVAFPGCIVKCT